MLYGRDSERSRIRELLEGARASRSGVLVISGEPGVGKSALLEDAREQAGDMLVLGSAGVESEAQLPFAALQQMVRPVLGHVASLPQPQAAALEGALGLAPGGGGDRFLVSSNLFTDNGQHVIDEGGRHRQMMGNLFSGEAAEGSG